MADTTIRARQPRLFDLGMVRAAFASAEGLEAAVNGDMAEMGKSGTCDFRMTRSLITHGVHPDDARFTAYLGCPLLQFSILARSFTLMHACLESGADVELEHSGSSALHVAANTGSLEAMQLLLQHGANPHARVNGATALFPAVMSEVPEAIELLLATGVDIEVRNAVRRTPLHEACTLGAAVSACVLVEWGASVSALDYGGRTPLEVAVDNPEMQLFIEAVEVQSRDREEGLRLLRRLRGGGTLRHAAREGEIDVIRRLLDEGFDPEEEACRNHLGRTALHVAAFSEQLEAMALLADSGMDINVKDRVGDTPLHSAAKGCSWSAVLFLLRRGADPGVRSGEEGFHWTPAQATMGGMLEEVLVLAESDRDAAIRLLEARIEPDE